MSESQHLKQLLKKLDAHFSDEEIRTLCFELNVDYDNLPGRAKKYKVRELLELLKRQMRVPELVKACSTIRPNIIWTYQARLFISYKRHATTDHNLATFLQEFLTEKGHHAFIDQTMRTGTSWLEEIDQQLKSSDFLIVLLSKGSADSEMVQAEVRRAYEYGKAQGHPHILPVRMAYEGLLPYTIDAFLNPLQYVTWQNETDNARVSQEIIAAIDGQLPEQQPFVSFQAEKEITIAEDGRIPAKDGQLSPPLPAFDPRFLEELIAPGGTVRLSDHFYIERDADIHFKRQLARPGSITTIRASRQTGKSSLLVRGVQLARQQKAKVINLDLQRLDQDHLVDPEIFLRYMADFIARQLRIEPQEVEKAWRGSLGPQDKLTYFIEDNILSKTDGFVVLAMDEVDRLLETDFYTDFFGLVRSWHNSAAYDERWEKLNIAMVISTEPYLLIADVNQSPFNVGLKLYLQDFNESQVQDLNQRHGFPIIQDNFSEFMKLLGGHPYLTRKALYTLVVENHTWKDFSANAASDQGPFSDHLRRHQWLLREEPKLQESLKQIIRHNRSDDDKSVFRLLRAGLVKGAGDDYTCRCDLYRLYFKDKL